MGSTAGKGNDATIWKRCSTCRGPVAFGGTYYVCSVSTCNRARTTYRFCKVECWEEHLPLMRHREAWAVEEKAPTREAWMAEEAAGAKQSGGAPAPQQAARKEAAPKAPSAPAKADAGNPRRRVVGSPAKPAAAPEPPGEVLVVVSRFKSYVRERFGMNTSDGVFDLLSDHLRAVARRAAENAHADGRKTVLDRDFEFLGRR